MIELKNVHKYFNKNKNNEIHVINNTNLSFPNSGLFCLVGPSGCGKTTLLNIIGGLDKVNSGEIVYGDVAIKKYNPYKWDNIRNRHFGYIFQNYVLLPNLTVYQNLEFVLKMLNLKGSEIKQRIDYALETVGMSRYKKRKPNQLSGGQQQRVAIARALVKSPDVVIADEPSGNLDEKNTTQIMNIIKKISKECLVILVTHERRLADFYGDVIIELLDGKVVNQIDVRSDSKELYNLDDNNIYLQDYNKASINEEGVNVQYYFDDQKPNLDLDIIYKDNTFYINFKQNTKLKVINTNSEIKVLDSKKPVIETKSIDQFDYYLPAITNDQPIKSPIKFRDSIKMAFAHLNSLRRRSKLLLSVFVLSAIMVTIGFTTYVNSLHIDEKDFLLDNRNLIEVRELNDISQLNYLQQQYHYLLAESNRLTVDSMIFNLYNHTANQTMYLPDISLLPIDVISNPRIVVGRLPENDGEVVLDKWVADQMLESSQFIMAGALFHEQFIGIEFYNHHRQINGTIVGIVDTNNPNIYMGLNDYRLSMLNRISYENIFSNLQATKYTEYYLFDDYLEELTQGQIASPVNLPILNNDEVIIKKTLIHLLEENTITFNNKTYTVIGFIDVGYQEDVIFSDFSIDEFETSYFLNEQKVTIYTKNKTDAINQIDELGLVGIDLYDEMYQKQRTQNFSFAQYAFSLTTLGASLIFLFFIMRSSLIARVYEVGVYRALGVRKSNIYRLFASEVLLVSVLTSLIGVLFISLSIYQLNQLSPFTLIYFPWYISIGSLAFIIGCNLIVGLIPVFNLLKLTPSQILSKYDI